MTTPSTTLDKDFKKLLELQEQYLDLADKPLSELTPEQLKKKRMVSHGFSKGLSRFRVRLMSSDASRQRFIEKLECELEYKKIYETLSGQTNNTN